MRLWFFVVVGASFLIGPNASTSPSMAQVNTPESAQEPGAGVLCLWAFASVASEVGKRCPGKRDEAFQPAVEASVKLFDEYVIANGGNAALVDKFKKEQGGAGNNDDTLCSGDPVGIYEGLREQGGTALLDATRKLVSRPGRPSWGDCV